VSLFVSIYGSTIVPLLIVVGTFEFALILLTNACSLSPTMVVLFVKRCDAAIKEATADSVSSTIDLLF
jgi:hypothetical protein